MKKVIQSILLYIVSAIGISLTLKADVGVSSFNAMNLSISEWTSIKVGTITFIANLIFLIGYICLCEKKDFKKFTLMFISILFFGMVINFFLYTIFGTIHIENYFVRIGLFIFGAILAGGTTGIILSLDIIPFPIESLCLRIAINKTLFLSIQILCRFILHYSINNNITTLQFTNQYSRRNDYQLLLIVRHYFLYTIEI
ncbi:hypothetical protein [Peribacillus huizhouensis]|uniref:Membrane protein YczE n=1 Tax=Peribacillus huizhouensis TaxID=1501239 RepID=A0ABR6CWB4_9BACI|nr:hypothetical protein [Peribacillus huizhouensis]MBA9029314.1 putative membrane protein YczE [Peribacillus huizhouensis]